MKINALTAREAQAAQAVSRGLRNREIAAELGVAERTVKKHLASACRKLCARSRLELALRMRDPRR